ncbi:hypothetical protein NDK43_14455 [Neobacillus pocheonensis]|uniref:DUF4190 domain-containing protein n=1 Tax=Neobacillus pocheonensis TaxID=363869 RepID=A0ABT0WAN1_9BACI|nr:hypothetical protein [Neobacillus pocheonensis]
MAQNQGGKGNDGSLKELWFGILITIGIFALAIFLLMLLNGNFWLAFGLAALFYIMVTVLSFKKGKKRLGQGLLIGLGVVLLLMAACFGILITSLGG